MADKVIERAWAMSSTDTFLPFPHVRAMSAVEGEDRK
jgi:hypothetical protein